MEHQPVRMKGLLLVDFILRIIGVSIIGLATLGWVIVWVAVLPDSRNVPNGLAGLLNAFMGAIFAAVFIALAIVLAVEILMITLLKKRSGAYRVLVTIGVSFSALNMAYYLLFSHRRTSLPDVYNILGLPRSWGDMSLTVSLVLLAIGIAYTFYLFKSGYCKEYFAKRQPVAPVYVLPAYAVPAPYGSPPVQYGVPVPYGVPYAPPYAPPVQQGAPMHYAPAMPSPAAPYGVPGSPYSTASMQEPLPNEPQLPPESGDFPWEPTEEKPGEQ